jgi:hypothetical protein
MRFAPGCPAAHWRAVILLLLILAAVGMLDVPREATMAITGSTLGAFFIIYLVAWLQRKQLVPSCSCAEGPGKGAVRLEESEDTSGLELTKHGDDV